MELFINRDKLHYSFRRIDSYNKPINIVISSREPGKTTNAWLDKCYKPFYLLGMTGIYILRQVTEITEAVIEDIENEINKFLPEDKQIHFTYKKTFLNGYQDIYVDGKFFFRIVALSIKMTRLKKMKVRGCGWMLFDEFIIDPRTQEHYLPNEAMRIKELYTTNNRTSFYPDKPIKMYFLGNPYSLFNPLFVDLGVDTSKLKIGEILVGNNYVIDFYKMKPELREFILKKNPFYQFDEDYKGYAVDGKPINDVGLKIANKVPPGFRLRFSIRIASKNLGVFETTDYIYTDWYYVSEIADNYGSNKDKYSFDFKDLVEGTSLFSPQDKVFMSLFKKAIQKRKVSYSSVSVAYYIQEIYNYI